MNPVTESKSEHRVLKPNETVQLYFDRAADKLELDPSMRRLLLTAKREVTVEVPVEMDDGRIETCKQVAAVTSARIFVRTN